LRANQLLRRSIFFSLIILSLLAVSRSAIRNAASLEFIEGYSSQGQTAHWLRAENLQRRAVDWHKGSPDESARLARIMVALGQTEEAISLWRAVSQPFAQFFLLEVGNSLWQKGEKSQAVAYWQTVPDLDIYFGKRGLAYERAGDFVTALDNYQISWMINDRALQSKGDFLLSFCELLRHQGKIPQATTACERAGESGNAFWSNLNLGILYSDQGDFVMAEMYFRQALAEKPSDVRANLWVGLSLANQRKLIQAVRFYRQGLMLAPDDGWLNYLMGKALWDSEQRNDAQGYLEKSVRFVPDSWEAAYLEDALRLLSQLQP
jgi:tetratricopeptide (TPR) repeat protein